MIRETVDVHDAIIPFGIGRLEEMASEDADEQWLSPEWAGVIANVLNQYHMGPNSRVSDVYWSVPRSAIRGILVRIRTALAELVAELIALTPEGQEVPDRQAADRVIQFVFTGDRSVLNYTVQHASGGGTNVAAADGPTAVAGAGGTAIGSQTASGANSSVVGTQEASGAGATVTGVQSTRAGRDATTAGRDAAVPSAGEQPVKEGWWARLRKRGVVVAFATIVGAIAAVAGVVVAIMIAAGWKP
jgi:AbiTii